MVLINKCLCFLNRTGSFISGLFTLICGVFSLLIVVLDLADTLSDDFQMSGTYKVDWRLHAWIGFLACDCVLIFVHLVMIFVSFALIWSLQRMTIDECIFVCRLWTMFTICYIFIEGGVVCYMFSWYGWNTWRFPWTVFVFMFWMVRLIVYILGSLTVYSRAQELIYEMKYGEVIRPTAIPFGRDDYSGRSLGYDDPLELGVRNPALKLSYTGEEAFA